LIKTERNQALDEVCGKRIVNVMVIFLKDSFQVVSGMVMEDIFFKMVTIILGSLKMIIMKELASL